LLRYGYAESKDYPERLISLIKRYNLDRFDLPISSTPIDIQLPVPSPTFDLNGVPFTMASGYESAQDIAYRIQVSLSDLLIYNEDLPLGYLLPQGQIVYLDFKRRKEASAFLIHLVQPSRPPILIYSYVPTALNAIEPPAPFEVKVAEFHTITKGDTLWSISRRYNTTVEAIKAMNSLSGELIRAGMVLRVRQVGGAVL
jgi:hypothetical protein